MAAALLSPVTIPADSSCMFRDDRMAGGTSRSGPGAGGILLMALLGLALPVMARAAREPGELIPAPRSIMRAGGQARLGAGTRIASDRPLDDAYAISVLAGLIDLCAAGSVPGPSDRCVRSIVLRSGPVRVSPDVAAADQAYSIVVSTDSVLITGSTAAARLYATQTLRQLARHHRGALSACTILDGPALAERGLSLDISRGRVPTAAEFTRILDVCAVFKLNVLLLYIEDTFPFSTVPKDAIRGYSLSPAALRDVATQARRRSITLVPIVQTLAHQERMLSHDSMRACSELNAPRSAWDRLVRTTWLGLARWLVRAGIPAAPPFVPSGTFAASDPGVQLLLRTMVDDVLEASGARAVHIGCDEATELGRGASALGAGGGGAERVYLGHVRRLAAHVWTRWGATTWVYDDFLLQHPALLDSLPANLLLVDWHYDPEAAFGSLDTLRRMPANRILTSAGLWNWFAIYPDYARALPNIRRATAAAQAHGCRGAILSSWGDGGSEDLFGNDVFGVAFFADRAWSPASAERPDFPAAYCRARFGDSAADALPVYRVLTRLELSNIGYNQRLVYRPVLLRERTPAWRAAMLALNDRMKAARAAISRVRPLDTDAAAELEALTSTVDRFLVSTEREITLDRLASDVEVASAEPIARHAAQGEALARVLEMERRAAARYAAAWRAHNEESELPAILARLRRQDITLDSLQRCAVSGRLQVPSRYRRPE
jgi:hypothetical protein